MEIFVILSSPNIRALGHEIHISRYLLYDLLQKNIIDNNVNIVTISKDRFFLYNNIFTNIHEWNDYKNNINKNNIKIIDLSHTYDTAIFIDRLKELNLKLNLNYSCDNFERSDKFVDDINNITIINQQGVLHGIKHDNHRFNGTDLWCFFRLLSRPLPRVQKWC